VAGSEERIYPKRLPTREEGEFEEGEREGLDLEPV